MLHLCISHILSARFNTVIKWSVIYASSLNMSCFGHISSYVPCRPSIYMGSTCKCKHIFCTFCNSFFLLILHFLTIACAQQWVHIRLSTNVSSILPLFIKIKWDTSAIEIKYFLLLATHFFSIFTKNYCIFSRQLVHNNTEYWTTSLSENEDYVRFRGWWDELVVTGMAPFIALVFFNARIYRKIRWER